MMTAAGDPPQRFFNKCKLSQASFPLHFFRPFVCGVSVILPNFFHLPFNPQVPSLYVFFFCNNFSWFWNANPFGDNSLAIPDSETGPKPLFSNLPTIIFLTLLYILIKSFSKFKPWTDSLILDHLSSSEELKNHFIISTESLLYLALWSIFCFLFRWDYESNIRVIRTR